MRESIVFAVILTLMFIGLLMFITKYLFIPMLIIGVFAYYAWTSAHNHYVSRKRQKSKSKYWGKPTDEFWDL